MASEVQSSDTQSAIEKLEEVLRKNYLRAKKLMALRNPNHGELKAISGEIDKTFEELIRAMASANLGADAIVAATDNLHEFMSRKDDWVSKRGKSSAAPDFLTRLPYLLSLMVALLIFLVLNLLGVRLF